MYNIMTEPLQVKAMCQTISRVSGVIQLHTIQENKETAKSSEKTLFSHDQIVYDVLSLYSISERLPQVLYMYACR